MSAASLPSTSSRMLEQAIAGACARIAPSWPLDQFIAVNPYWGWVDQPIETAAAALGTLAGSRLTMPRAWFQAEWAAGRLTRAHLAEAAERAVRPEVQLPDCAREPHARAAQVNALVGELLRALEMPATTVLRPTCLTLMTDLRDAMSAPRAGQSWSELVTHQVSQHCAAYFGDQQATWNMDRGGGLFGSWRRQLGMDHGLPWRRGSGHLRACLTALPTDARASIPWALSRLGTAPEGQQPYLSAVLLSVGGWAAWCAYLRWQARLCASDDDAIEHLLAIRLGWEWLLHDDAQPGSISADWAMGWSQADAAADALATVQRTDWLLQHAVEVAEQQKTIAGLTAPVCPAAAPACAEPAVQAVFCIDVRSEVFRRALEGVDASIHTRGFAGFFGMPIAYQPLGSALTRPQLPGLLAPAMRVTETVREGGARAPRHEADGPHLAQVLAARRQRALQWREPWAAFRSAPASAFSFVESGGLLYGGGLLTRTLARHTAPARWEDAGLPRAAAGALRPSLPQVDSDLPTAAALGHGILTAMGLVRDFAPLVLLAGHGSQTANNAHAAGLDCGACGGQSGEVNARVLADLLNRQPVRDAIAALGISIPAGTHFLPGVHNTTTDELRLLDTDAVPLQLSGALRVLQASLAAAGRVARAERAASLGLAALATKPAALHRALRERANDWSQVRPEWGLANNASFIVAPRARSRHMHLDGRSFLHDYDHRLDPEGKVLTLIMTAPMVVTNWINLQYHASCVDPQRYGSGNKLLHNVVGGHIGVFEGNGGDLRIGLPWQSLHDGARLRHTPLRLSVYIEARRDAIDDVLQAHAAVRHLVLNGWLHLFCIDPATGAVVQRNLSGWRESAL